MASTKLPPRGIHIDDLKCKKCGKKMGECKPKDCTDPECDHKKLKGKRKEKK